MASVSSSLMLPTTRLTTNRTTLSRHCQLLESQLLAKDEQIKNLQSAMDQAQQLHALSQKHHEAELAKIEGRGFLQRLKAVFITN